MKKLTILAVFALAGCAAPVSQDDAIQAIAALSSEQWSVLDDGTRRTLNVPGSLRVAAVSGRPGISYMLVGCDDGLPGIVEVGLFSVEVLADRQNQRGGNALVSFIDGTTEWFSHNIELGYVSTERWSPRDVIRRTSRDGVISLQVDDYSPLSFAGHKRRGAIDQIFGECREAWSVS